MANEALILMLGFTLKHDVADFLLQFSWMIVQKGSLTKPGGYVHAAIHAAGTALLLWILGVDPGWIAVLSLAELVFHFVVDFTKARTSDHISSVRQPNLFWGVYGLDQLVHYLTYITLTYLVINLAA